MQKSSLLAEVALRLARSPEDVATEALLYILTQSQAARSLVQRLAGEWIGARLRPIVTFRSQVGADDQSRPDLEGHDAHGTPVVIFENKFEAGLTQVQPVSYLRRLEAQGGVLLIVAPARRMAFLWPGLMERARKAFGGLEPLNLNDMAEVKGVRVGKGVGMVLVSWGFLLTQIRQELDAAGESFLAADVQQLRGLADKMETSAFVPFTVTDLTGPTARLVMQFCEIVDRVVGILRSNEKKYPFFSKKGKKTQGGRGWYGHYCFLYQSECFLCFTAAMWEKYGKSPVWLFIESKSSEGTYDDAVERALSAHHARSSFVVLRDGDWQGVWVPLGIVEGSELDEVLDTLVHEIDAIAQFLKDIRSSGKADAMPPDAELA